jgi:Skp family chaperone for outer membrane proteins
MVLLRQSGPAAAAAEPPGQARLGPAEALVLGARPDEVVLTARGGRLAWAQSDHAAAYSIAFVDVMRPIGPLLEEETYRQERRRLEQEIDAADQELARREAALRDAAGHIDPATPQARAFLAERERWGIERARRMARLAASHIESAYREVVAAVEVVAQRRGVDIVWRFVPTAEPFDAFGGPQAYSAILNRTVLRYPEALDITDDVLKELAIDAD